MGVLKQGRIPYLFLFMAAATLLVACELLTDELLTDRNSGVFFGETQPLGNGTARSWVELEDGTPVAIGVRLSEAALTGLPQHISHAESETVLPLPEEASGTPFNHIGLNWNPEGHIPKAVYGVPHFDFHFYLISQQ